MRWIVNIQTPVKIFIIAISLMVLAFISVATYLTIADNSTIERIYNYLSGYTEAEEVVEQEISFGTIQENDENLEEGSTKTKQEGIVGKKRITYLVLRDKSGQEIKRTLINEEVVVTPTDEIVAIGTKKPEEPEEGSSDSSDSYSYNSGGNAYYGGGQSYSGNTGGYSGGGGEQQSQPQPEPTPEPAPSTPTYYYCTTKTVGWSGTNYRRYYLKQTMPCPIPNNKWSNHDYPVSEAIYYAQEFKWTYDSYGIVEIRVENCPGDYSTHGSGCIQF